MGGTVLHVGLHKTGTTALQNALAANRDVLAELGLIYPQDPGGADGHHAIACSLSGPRASAEFNGLFRQERESYAKWIGARAAPRIDLAELSPRPGRMTILSTEIFCTFDQAETAALAAFAAPVDRCVAYVRGGIGFVHACWSTKARWGYAHDFDVFLAAAAAGEENSCIQGPLSYFELLLRMFGEERLRLRSYEAALVHPRGIAGDFLEAELGVHGSNVVAGQANASPSVAFTELARAVLFDACAEPERPAPSLVGPFAALIRSAVGQELIGELLPTVDRCLRPIRIADVQTDGGVIGADGCLEAPPPSLAPRLAVWRFPPDEPLGYARLSELRQVLNEVPAYGRLVRALSSAGR